ncbi:type II toxin-antitoxin system HicB family antitoxin [Shewanella glacialipiscicola]|uniref:type II toxin-antitoxin system HicB family antitoxin n=2 Tax=Shewanella glacialipiscicola TaxID=614069 RepID=UPI003D794978
MGVVLFGSSGISPPTSSERNRQGRSGKCQAMARKRRGKSMKNLMMINGVKAFIDYDPDAETFRGEFVGLNGGADFYGESIAQLETEGAKSLSVFLEMCKERDIEPYKNFSGKFNVRISPEVHARLNEIALSQSISLNAAVENAVYDYIEHSA